MVVLLALLMFPAIGPWCWAGEEEPIGNEWIAEKHFSIQTAHGEVKDYFLGFPLGGQALHPVAQKCFAGVCFANDGQLDIVIPLEPRLPCASSLMKLSVTRSDGGEEVTYAQLAPEPSMLLVPEGRMLLVTIPSQTWQSFASWFTPWSPGIYEVRVEISNDVRSHYVFKRKTYPEHKELSGYRNVDQKIENVFVGKVVQKEKIEVTEELYGSVEVKLYGSLYVDMKGKLQVLKEGAMKSDGSLSHRLGALRALVEERHVFATATLVEIEKATRDDGLFHPQVVRALYDIAMFGTGYRCLDLFAAIAQDRKFPVNERFLCADVLKTFATQKELRNEGRVTHVISKDEKERAAAAIKKLTDGLADDAPAIRDLLGKR